MMLPPASRRPSSAASACSTASPSSPHGPRASQPGTTPDRTPDSRFSLRLRDPGGRDTARDLSLQGRRCCGAPWSAQPSTNAHTRENERPNVRASPVGRGTRRSPRCRTAIEGWHTEPEKVRMHPGAPQPLRPDESHGAPWPRPGRLPRAAPPRSVEHCGSAAKRCPRPSRRRGHRAAPQLAVRVPP